MVGFVLFSVIKFIIFVENKLVIGVKIVNILWFNVVVMEVCYVEFFFIGFVVKGIFGLL